MKVIAQKLVDERGLDEEPKIIVLCFVLSLLGNAIYAQTPVFKVNLNISDRQEDEVNELGFIPWSLKGGSESKTIEGVPISFLNGSVESAWYKAGIQAPNYARLANDGISTSSVEMHISGLQIGKHSLLTFHNKNSKLGY